LYKIIKSSDILKIPWILIILDFVIKLLLSQDPITGIKYDFILVIIDKLTKYTYMIFVTNAHVTRGP
jgi:hypothetical protein